MKEFVLQTRYEYIGTGGKVQWTKWFASSAECFPESVATDVLQKAKESTAYTDKKTKLHHEHRLYGASEYERELNIKK